MNYKQIAQDIIKNIDNKSEIDRTIDLADFYEYYSDMIKDYLETYSELTDKDISSIFEYMDKIIMSGEF